MNTALEPVKIRPCHRLELEFLPAALEIIETPPSPVGRLGGYLLMAVFASALVWASVGRVDVVTVAKGKIIPTGNTKVVQPFETGVVSAIHVHDGQVVKAGEPLIDLDPTMNKAEVAHVRGDLLAARVDIARLTAALKSIGDSNTQFVAPPGTGIDQANMGRQFFLGQVSAYRSKVAALVADETQKQAERDSLKVSITKIQAVLPMMQERTQMKKTLFDHENGSKLSYLDALQELVSNQKDLDIQGSRLRELDAAAGAAKARREEAQAEYRRAVLGDLVDAARKVSGLEQDVAKAEQRTSYQALVAPIDGTVQQLAVHTIGGVVTPAESLLSIVPADSRMEIEATVDNQDIGFVHPGQAAEIKVDTFNFTRYGLRHGTIETISHDAIARRGVDPTNAQTSQAQQNDGGAAQSQDAGYAAHVSLDRTQMQVDDKMLSLSPGMSVTVEIKTGTRRIIDYLLSPLLRHAQESLHER